MRSSRIVFPWWRKDGTGFFIYRFRRPSYQRVTDGLILASHGLVVVLSLGMLSTSGVEIIRDRTRKRLNVAQATFREKNDQQF